LSGRDPRALPGTLHAAFVHLQTFARKKPRGRHNRQPASGVLRDFWSSQRSNLRLIICRTGKPPCYGDGIADSIDMALRRAKPGVDDNTRAVEPNSCLFQAQTIEIRFAAGGHQRTRSGNPLSGPCKRNRDTIRVGRDIGDARLFAQYDATIRELARQPVNQLEFIFCQQPARLSHCCRASQTLARVPHPPNLHR
jgi:hypothetical protein